MPTEKRKDATLRAYNMEIGDMLGIAVVVLWRFVPEYALVKRLV